MITYTDCVGSMWGFNEKGYGKHIYHRSVNSTLSMNNKWRNMKYENSCFGKSQNVINTGKSEI